MDIVECSICLENIENLNLCTLSCNHTFHADCIITSAINKNSCPICRNIIIPSSKSTFTDYSSLKKHCKWLTQQYNYLHECYDLLLSLKSNNICKNCKPPPSEVYLQST